MSSSQKSDEVRTEITWSLRMRKFKFGNDPRLKSIIEFAIQKKCGMAIVKDQGVYLLAVHKKPGAKEARGFHPTFDKNWYDKVSGDDFVVPVSDRIMSRLKAMLDKPSIKFLHVKINQKSDRKSVV